MNRILKRSAVFCFCSCFWRGTARAALPDRLIPGGQAIGLQLQTDGVSIVELAQDKPLRAGGRAAARRRHPRH